MVPDPFILLYLISRYFMEGQLAPTGGKKGTPADCSSFILICARIKASLLVCRPFMRISWIQADQTSEYTLTLQFNQERDKKGRT